MILEDYCVIFNFSANPKTNFDSIKIEKSINLCLDVIFRGATNLENLYQNIENIFYMKMKYIGNNFVILPRRRFIFQ